ncbi:MAG: T9SS type A sorting domain-containing protein [Raineya sp.]|jgi:hypothetical protein|nr:T9SS type A sorting domain-containing protein [Raineya sp.]
MRIIYIVVLLILKGIMAPCQIQIHSIFQNAQNVNQHISERATLVLPFFDDFLGNSIDGNLWINKGTTITNGVALNPVSRGVATLDSYNQFGKVYNFSSPQAIGFSDTLATQEIDLSTLTASDNIYLSFFWQAQGLGEQPDPEDFLRLEAKKADNTWQTIWQKDGSNPPVPNFEQVILPINQTEYLHDKFQFRFVRYGKLSGNFDVWHIDYVYLNKNRSLSNITYPDIATTQSRGSYFKGYTAMPAKHFFENSNPNQFLNNKITFNLKNLDATFRVLSYQCRVVDAITSTTVATLPLTALSTNAPLIFPNEDFKLEATPQMPTLPNTTTKAILKTRLEVNTSDNNAFIPPIDFRNNDTIVHTTILDDYYAYDDGEAEYVAGVNQRLGRIAVKFPIAQEAQLTDVDINIVPFIKDLSSQTFVLSVWKTVGGRNQEVLFQRSVPVRYSNVPNGFIRISVDSFQVVKAKDTIFVGIQQTTEDLIAIGFDVNNDNGSQIYFNTSGIWEQDSNIKGSLMIRPVFKNSVITALENQDLEKKFRMYPNPAQNFVKIEGEQIQNVWIMDTQGKIQVSSWQQDNQKLHFNLSKGLYIVNIETKQGKVVRKKLIVNE